MELKGKIALVTGAGSGLGAQTAQMLCEQGVKVVFLDRNIEGLHELAHSKGGVAIQCDVTDENQVQNAITETVKKFGAIHLLIQCAGVVSAGRIVNKQGPMPLDNFIKTIQINLIGTFNVMRLVSNQMMHQEPQNVEGARGVIINTASIAAYDGQLGQVAYSASKGGVAAMTLPAARELGAYGIRVITIAPGIMDTPMMGSLSEAAQISLSDQVIFPKRLGKPTEFSFLVKQIIENEYLNATVIRLDGGIRMGIK